MKRAVNKKKPSADFKVKLGDIRVRRATSGFAVKFIVGEGEDRQWFHITSKTGFDAAVGVARRLAIALEAALECAENEEN